MPADALLSRWMSLLLASILLTTGCASLTPPPVADVPDDRPLTLASPRPSVPEEPQRLSRRRGSREAVTRVGPGNVARAVGGAVPRDAAASGRQIATETRQAVLAAVGELRGSTSTLASALSKLVTRPTGLGNRGLTGVNGAFTRHLDHGSHSLPWLHGALGSATTLTEVAAEVADSNMELALLRMSGPRLQAAMSGALLLAAWVDFLQLADVVLRECPAYGVEKLSRDMHRVRGMVAPSMAALASANPGGSRQRRAGSPS